MLIGRIDNLVMKEGGKEKKNNKRNKRNIPQRICKRDKDHNFYLFLVVLFFYYLILLYERIRILIGDYVGLCFNDKRLTTPVGPLLADRP